MEFHPSQKYTKTNFVSGNQIEKNNIGSNTICGGSNHGFPSLKLEATSRFDIEEFVLEWKLNIFSYGNLAKTETVESPIFLGGERGKHSWKLRWKPDRERWGRFCVEVILVSFGESRFCTRGKLKATGIVSFKDSDSGNPSLFEREQNELTFFGVETGGKVPVLNPWISYDQLYRPNEMNQEPYIVDNVLTVRCRILVNCGIHQSKILETIIPRRITRKKELEIAEKMQNIQEFPVKEKCDYNSLVGVMSSILNSSDFSDVQLVTKTKVFAAHKVILAARSPVFAAMFRTQMLESKENSVEIPDFDEQVLGSLLEFIYTSKLCKLSDENYMDLFRISDMYEIMELKSECEQRIIGGLKIENAVQVLDLAILYNSVELREAALKFIQSNKQDVAQTEAFKKIVDKSPCLLLELYLAE